MYGSCQKVSPSLPDDSTPYWLWLMYCSRGDDMHGIVRTSLPPVRRSDHVRSTASRSAGMCSRTEMQVIRSNEERSKGECSTVQLVNRHRSPTPNALTNFSVSRMSSVSGLMNSATACGLDRMSMSGRRRGEET